MLLETLVVALEAQIDDFKKGLDKADKEAESWSKNLGGKVAKFAGGAALGAATAAVGAVAAIGVAAFNVSSDVEAAAGDMAASLGIPIEEAERFAEVAKRVYGNNFAESVGDAAAAVENVAKTMKLAADDPALQQITEDAFRLRDAFGYEVQESVSAAQSLMENFGISSTEAFDMLASGYQKGLDRSGDLLDTINEYSTQFANGGASASEFFSLLESGLAGGALGTDKAADAFKEFRLRIADGSEATEIALENIGISSREMTAGMADGSITAADAFQLVVEKISAIDDPAKRMQAGAALIGSQFEDLGDSAVAALSMTEDWAAGSEGAISNLDAQYNTFGDAVDGVWRRLVVSVSPFTDKLLDIVNNAMPAVMGAFDTFDATVGPVMVAAGSIIDQTVGAIRGVFERFGGSIDVGASKPLAYLKDWADQNLPRLQQIFQTVLGAIQGFWGAFGESIMTVVDFAFGTVWTVIDTMMRNIGDLVTGVLQILTGDFDEGFLTILGIVERTVTALWGIMQDLVGTIVDAVTQIDWLELGESIIMGMVNGITNMSQRLWDAARGVSQNLWDRMTGWWQTGSPSRKAEDELGVPIAQGLMIGIGDGIDMSAIDASMGSVFEGMSFAEQPIAGATNTYITINISGADREESRLGVLDGLRQAGVMA